MTESRWKVSNTSVFNINYHLIWVTKYRLPLLKDDIEARLKILLKEKAEKIDVTINSFEVMPEHVHLFVSSPPNLAPHYIVQQLKGFTSRALRKEFPEVKSRTSSLWTRSYYCESVGNISEETVVKYIKNQKKRNA